MNKIIVQKMSGKKYHIINPKIISNRYLKPISSREKKFIKERQQLNAVFQIYLTLINRIINGSILIKDSLLSLFGYDSSTFSNIISGITGGFCLYNNMGETIERVNSDKNINNLRGSYVLRDKDFMERNYYYLFLEQLGAIINMSKTTNYYNYIKNKSQILSGKYGIATWVVITSMVGLTNIWYAIESSNQEIKNLFIEGTDIINEPYLVIDK